MVIILVPIAVILTAYVAYAASQQSHAWADAIVRGFTAWIVKLPLVGEAVERLITSGATWIANKLGNYFLQKAERVINWIGGLAHYARMVANATIDWPVELLSTVRWLLTQEIPHLIRGLPNAVTKLVHQAQAIIRGLERDVGRLTAHLPGQVRRLIHAGLIGLLGPFLLPLRWLLKVWRVISHAAVHAGGIAVPWIEVPRVRKRLRKLEADTTKLWKLLGVAGAAALIARALQINVRCVTRGPLGKVARRLCGISATALEDLLGLIADVVIVTEICEVIPYLEQGLNVIAGPLSNLIGEAGAALCGDDFDPPPRLSVPALSLPALVGVTAVEV